MSPVRVFSEAGLQAQLEQLTGDLEALQAEVDAAFGLNIAAIDDQINQAQADAISTAQDYVDATPTTKAITADYGFSTTPGWELTDAGNTILKVSSSSPVTITLPTDAQVPFDTNSEIHFSRQGSGTVTFAQGSATLQAANGLLTITSQYGAAVLRKEDTDVWTLEST